MLKKSLGLLAGLFVSLAVFAAGAQLRADHPDSYVVKKGDTLWDIAARFLHEPWLWPEIWRANPQVANPHLIYPGDVLNLAYNELGEPYVKVEPAIRESDLAPTPPLPLSAIEPFLKDMRVVDAAALQEAPYILAFEDQHLRGSVGQYAYARGVEATPGQTFAVVRPRHAYRVFDADKPEKRDLVAHELDANINMNRGPWREITRGDGHWTKGESLGVEVEVIATARMQQAGDPSSLVITDANKAVRAGDRLLPVDDSPYDTTYYPHAPASVPDDLRVLAFADAAAAAGRLQVVALSAGSSEGIDNGSTFTVFHPGRTVHDDMVSAYDRRTFGEKVTLPAEYVGHVMVFRTFEHVSYALVMDSYRGVHLGDQARAPE